MNILFLHGLESKPGGSKVEYLRSLGHTVYNPSLPGDDWDRSVEIAEQALNREIDCIVGSSRGGALAVEICRPTNKVVLIAPAWKKYCSKTYVPHGTIILHSRKDDIIPIDDSEFLVKDIRDVTLVEVGLDHRMSDATALAALKSALG